MTFQESIDYLYNSLPVFQRVGASAYKPGLATSIALDDMFGNPHRQYPIIHVAGTNGKGSTAHTLAAVLQSAGYKVGLYTSPHLFDFRERIRVNGDMISKAAVVSFVERWMDKSSKDEYCHLSPSFFELTSTMAFEYFANENVDVAIIEVGLGGRLDSTNIVTPILSIITNISLDHTSLLGNTLPEIAFEKAGIIKHGVPVVIGEYQKEITNVFKSKATEEEAELIYASPVTGVVSDDYVCYKDTIYGDFTGELQGEYQIKNTATVLAALHKLEELGFAISNDAVYRGFGNVTAMTHLMGRWMTIGEHPHTVCDTGHNSGGWHYITSQLEKYKNGTVHLIIGFAADKDITSVLKMIAGMTIPLHLYYSSPSVKRGLDARKLAEKASCVGLKGEVVNDVNDALTLAKNNADPDKDMILIAGSNFLIADLKI